jgi:hypothetical protein
MAKFNTTATWPAKGNGPIAAESTPSTLTHEGAPGYVRDVKSELFLLAVSNMVGEDTFYERATDRDARYEALVRQATAEDSEWTSRLLAWLRTDGNMRSAPLVGAAAFAHERLKRGEAGMSRQVIASVLQRADEPGELLAYWTSRFGRAIPKPVKRGIADAIGRLYNEYALLKYDTDSKGFRFADVIDLVHPDAVAPWQGELFRYALDRRHGRGGEITGLPMVDARMLMRSRALGDEPQALLDAEALKRAGMTWEDALSLAGDRVDKAKLWEAVIPSMGYMALLRNLRNFDEAGVSDAVAEQVAARLADPQQVVRSRQFPFRFLAAYENAPSLRWGHALDKALSASLANVPRLDGKTLVLIDTSASMTSMSFSARSKMGPAKAAAVFGVVLAIRCGADLYGFADDAFRHDVPKGASALKEIGRFLSRTGEVGHGTQIAASLRRTWNGHDRVFLVSDMQTMDSGATSAVPPSVALYGFNLGGYRPAAFSAGAPNRTEFGGLTDATFRMIPLIEAGRHANWPF